MDRLSVLFQIKGPKNSFDDGIYLKNLYNRRLGWVFDKISEANPVTVLNSIITRAIAAKGVDINIAGTTSTLLS
jgi:hypothetical protein